MGIEVVHLVCIDVGIAQGVDHRTTRAVHIRCRHVPRVAAHAVSGEFSVDFGTPLFSVFVFFQDHNASTLTQNKTVTVFVPRA